MDAPGAVQRRAWRTARAGPDRRRPAARAVAGAGADRGAAARCRRPLSGRRPLEADARLRESPRGDRARRARAARPAPLRSARSRSGKDRRRLGRRADPAQEVPARRRSAGAPRLRRPEGAARRRAKATLALVLDLPADLAATLAPLDEVLDTYGDLLVDRRRARAGHRTRRSRQRRHGSGRRSRSAARAARHPHAARGDHRARERVGAAAGCRTSPAGPNADPARVADPAFAAARRRRTRRRRLRMATTTPMSNSGAGFATVLGGADDDAPVPSLTGGGYEGLPLSADADLQRAIATDLRDAAHARSSPWRRRRTMRSRCSIPTMAPPTLSSGRRQRGGRSISSGSSLRIPQIAAPTTAERLAHVVATLSDRLAAAAGAAAGHRWTLARPTTSSIS